MVTLLDAFLALMVIAATPVFLTVTLPVSLSTVAILGLELVKIILLLDVALILNVYVTTGIFSKVEHGLNNPSVDMLVALTGVFQCDFNEFFQK